MRQVVHVLMFMPLHANKVVELYQRALEAKTLEEARNCALEATTLLQVHGSALSTPVEAPPKKTSTWGASTSTDRGDRSTLPEVLHIASSKYAGTCCLCGLGYDVGDSIAWWPHKKKTVAHSDCHNEFDDDIDEDDIPFG